MSCACDTDCSTLVSIPGPRGISGTDGDDGSDGINAFTFTTAAFEMPAESDDVTVAVEENSWAAVGQLLYITNAGTMQVVSKTGTTQLLLLNVENTGTGAYSGNATPGTTISSGQQVSPTGREGEDGSDGTNGTDGSDGLNAFTVTTANFAQPAEGVTVNVEVASSAWIANGQHLYVTGGGDYEVTAIPDATHVTIRNLENTASGLYPGNAAPAAVISSGAKVSPGGLQGPTGQTGATGAAGAATAGANYFHAVKNGVDQNQNNGVHTAISFGTELFDPSAVWNAGTSIWTAPATGFYLFIVQATVTVLNAEPTDNQLSLYKNGSFGVGTLVAATFRERAAMSNSSNATLTMTTILSLTAGDTIQVDHIQNAGATPQVMQGDNDATFICGYRIA